MAILLLQKIQLELLAITGNGAVGDQIVATLTDVDGIDGQSVIFELWNGTTVVGTASSVTGTGITASTTFTINTGDFNTGESISVRASYTDEDGTIYTTETGGENPVLSGNTIAPGNTAGTLAITGNGAVGDQIVATLTDVDGIDGQSVIFELWNGTTVVGTASSVTGTGITVSTTFTINTGDFNTGESISVRASYTDEDGTIYTTETGGENPVLSGNTIAAKNTAGTLAITGNGAVGDQIVATLTDVDGLDGQSVIFELWNGTTVVGTASSVTGTGITVSTTFTINTGDFNTGESISVRASYTDEDGTIYTTETGGENPVLSGNTITPENTAGTLAITGNGAVGDQIVATLTDVDGIDGQSVIFELWNGTTVVGTASSVTGNGITASTTFTINTGDFNTGESISVRASYTDEDGTIYTTETGGENPVLSGNTITPGNTAGTLAITGNGAVGDQIVATLTDVDGIDGQSVIFELWNGTTVVGTANSITGTGTTASTTFTINTGDFNTGESISVRASYTDEDGTIYTTETGGENPVLSGNTIAAKNTAGTLAITGNGAVGDQIVATLTDIDGIDGQSIIFELWNGTTVVGTASSVAGTGITVSTTFTINTGDFNTGESISVRASYTDEDGTIYTTETGGENPVLSGNTIAPENTAGTLAITGNGAVGDQIVATLTDVDGLDGQSVIFELWNGTTVVGTASSVTGNGITASTTFTINTGDFNTGESISVRASYTDEDGTIYTTETGGENPVLSGNTITPENTLGTLAITGNGAVGDQIVATLTDVDGIDGQSVIFELWNGTTVVGTASSVTGNGITASTTFTINTGDFNTGESISVRASYTDEDGTIYTTETGGENPVLSSNTIAPENTAGTLAITGNGAVGDQIVATLTDVDGIDGQSVIFELWNGTTVVGTASPVTGTGITASTTFTINTGDFNTGESISVRASYTDEDGTIYTTETGGENPILSGNTIAAKNTAGTLAITGNGAVGDQIVATLTDVDGIDGQSIIFELWNGTTVVGTASPVTGTGITASTTFTINAGYFNTGESISVRASYTDEGGTVYTTETEGENPILSGNTIAAKNTAGTLAITGNGAVGDQIVATLTDVDGIDGQSIIFELWNGTTVVGTASPVTGTGITASTTFTINAGYFNTGESISVRASYTDEGGTVYTTETGGENPVLSGNTIAAKNTSGTLAITGNGAVGDQIVATLTDIDGLDGQSIIFELWNGTTVVGTASSVTGTGTTASTTFTINTGDFNTGESISVRASYTDEGGTVYTTETGGENPVLSNIIGITENIPAIITRTKTGVVTEGGTLIATGNLDHTDADDTNDVWQVQTAQSTSYGSYSIDVSGNWTYHLDNTHTAVQSLNTGANLIDSFRVLTEDGTSQVVSITINGLNSPAIITGKKIGTVTEDGTLIATGYLHHTDPDNDDDLWQAQTILTGYGTYSIDSSGSWTYHLTDDDLESKVFGFTILGAGDGGDRAGEYTLIGNDPSVNLLSGLTLSLFNTEGDEVGTPANYIDGNIVNVNDFFGGSFPPVRFSASSSSAIENDNGFIVVSSSRSFHAERSNNDVIELLSSSDIVVQDSRLTPNNIITGSRSSATSGGVSGTEISWYVSYDNFGRIITDTVSDASSIIQGESKVIHQATGVSSKKIAQIYDIIGSGRDFLFVDGSGTMVSSLDVGTIGSLTIVGKNIHFSSSSSVTGGVKDFAIRVSDGTNHSAVGFFDFFVSTKILETLATGETIIDTFTVQTGDGTEQVVSITINGAGNIAAIITGKTTGAVTEDGTLIATGGLDHTDGDNTNDVWQAQTAQSTTYGSYSIDVSGNWTYNLDNENTAVQTLKTGANLIETFTVLTEDGTEQIVSITITGMTETPIFTTGVNEKVNEGLRFVSQGGASLTKKTYTFDGEDDYLEVEETANSGVFNFGGDFVISTFITYDAFNNWSQAISLGNGPNNKVITIGNTGLTGTLRVRLDDLGNIEGTTKFILENFWVLGERTHIAVSVEHNKDDDGNIITGTGAGGSLSVYKNGVLIGDTDNDGDTLDFTEYVETLDRTGNYIGKSIWGDDYFEGKIEDLRFYHQALSANEITEVIENRSVRKDGRLITKGDLNYTNIDNDDDVWQVQTAQSSSYGSYSIDSSGNWTYHLDNSHTAVQGLANGGTLTDSFTAVTGDGTNQIVSITINGLSAPAVITGTKTGAVTEDGTLIATGDLDHTDPDNDDDVWQAQTILTGYGTYSIDFSGNWTYHLADDNLESKVFGFTIHGQGDAGERVAEYTLIGNNPSVNLLSGLTLSLFNGQGNALGTPADHVDGNISNWRDFWSSDKVPVRFSASSSSAIESDNGFIAVSTSPTNNSGRANNDIIHLLSSSDITLQNAGTIPSNVIIESESSSTSGGVTGYTSDNNNINWYVSYDNLGRIITDTVTDASSIIQGESKVIHQVTGVSSKKIAQIYDIGGSATAFSFVDGSGTIISTLNVGTIGSLTIVGKNIHFSSSSSVTGGVTDFAITVSDGTNHSAVGFFDFFVSTEILETLATGETIIDTFTVLTEDGTSEVVSITINGADEASTTSFDYNNEDLDFLNPLLSNGETENVGLNTNPVDYTPTEEELVFIDLNQNFDGDFLL